jgi:cysteinyl-tRNA synthetase
VQGNVYFSVEKFSLYGIQSGRNLEEMVAGARVDVNEEKNNPLDFALWKVSKPGEPSWESPWGKGRPGWHIECSAMSRRYLGDTFDIHGGGEDLIFPHHENEIAQSQAATGKPPANYWMHNGFVRVNAEKMSKSRGNYFSIREILKAHHPEVVRLFILQSHYRSPVDFSEKSLTEARLSLVRCYTALKAQKEIKATLPVVDTGSSQNMSAKAKKIIQSLQELGNKFGDALDDDFNTAKALGYVFESVRLLNNYFIAEKNASPEDKANVLKTSNELFAYFGSILGIFQEDPSNFFIFDKEKESFKRGLSIEKIEKLIEDRKAARMAKNWAKADEIRKQLLNMGVVLKDIDNTTSWIIE